MVPTRSGFELLSSGDVLNKDTAPLVGGFVAGCAVTLALIGMLAQFNNK